MFPLRILHLNTSDIQGGAARAAYRIHRGLKALGHDSSMLVQSKTSDEYDIKEFGSKFQTMSSKVCFYLEHLPLKMYKNRNKSIFSPAIFSANSEKDVDDINPDIIHLHWDITRGFTRIGTLKKFNKPIVWTFHDMWGFTGGCHYDGECGRYTERCGNCPVLNSSRENDLSRKIWTHKYKAWKDIDLTIVSPSSWLAECAKSSSLFKVRRVEVVHNGIDLNVFKPIDKSIATDILGIDKDKKIILFGAMSATSDKRKGFQYLEKALSQLPKTDYDQYVLVVMGASEPKSPPKFGLECLYLGRLHDEVSLSLLYSAADVFVAPSIQENLANTVVESLACGTPVVAFNIGGMPDMIEHKINGYLAQPFEPEDLARGIKWVLEDEERKKCLSQKAREKAKMCFDVKQVAQQYLKLYEEVLGSD